MEVQREKYRKMGFLGLPDEVLLTLGKGTAPDSLSALDRAELDAGIPDVNVIVATSFIPPAATLVYPDRSRTYLREHPVIPGSLVPAAFKFYSSTRRRQQRAGIVGEKIFAAIGVVVPKEKNLFAGIIMEYAGPQEQDDPATRSKVEQHCIQMCQTVAEFRYKDGFVSDGPPQVWVVEQELPEDDGWGCVLVAGLYLRTGFY